MLRKTIQRTANPAGGFRAPTELDLPANGQILLSSENGDHPIEHALDEIRGKGGTRWIARDPGPQTVVVVFDRPQDLRGVTVEIEEPDVARQ